jgi:ABC-type transporter Mla subunit MlaD
MTKMSTHFKLGLFTLAALAALVVTGIVLGVHLTSGTTVAYHTYFDESVAGLDVGSVVEYRGVRIGSVAEIAIAPDRRHVDVELALHQREARRLGLAASPPAVRAQLANQGITGVKNVELDFFDPQSNPRPQLPFPPAAHYIPSRRSLLKGLAENLETLGERLPDLIERGTNALAKLDLILDDIRDQRLATRFGDTIDRAGRAIGDIQRLVRHVDGAKLPEQTARTLHDLDAAFARLDGALAHVDGDGGLIASARRATDSIGELGRAAAGSTDDVAAALREIGDAARAVRELAESIDRDPGMLVSGRAPSRRP